MLEVSRRENWQENGEIRGLELDSEFQVARLGIEIQSQQELEAVGQRERVPSMLPLQLLRSGEWADVTEVTGEPCWIGRLAELGIRAGCRLCVLQPGSPCLLEVDGCRLSLRGDLATQILVQPVLAN